MKDRYYFALTTNADGTRQIHFFGNLYESEEGIFIEEYKGAQFPLDSFNFTNATQEEVKDYFYEFIYDSREGTEADLLAFSGTEISIFDIASAPDGEYYIEAYNL